MDTPSNPDPAVTVITFAGGSRLSDNPVADQLQGQTDELEEGHLMLDFANVDYITSLELGTLVSLNKRIRTAGGQLTLFNLSDHVYEVFVVTALDRFFTISDGDPFSQDRMLV